MVKRKVAWTAEVEVSLVHEGSGQTALYDYEGMQAENSNALAEAVADMMWQTLCKKIPEYQEQTSCGKALRAVRFTISVQRREVADEPQA